MKEDGSTEEKPYTYSYVTVTQYACILAVHPTNLNNTGNCVILSPLGLPDSAALDHAVALHRCMMQ